MYVYIYILLMYLLDDIYICFPYIRSYLFSRHVLGSLGFIVRTIRTSSCRCRGANSWRSRHWSHSPYVCQKMARVFCRHQPQESSAAQPLDLRCSTSCYAMPWRRWLAWREMRSVGYKSLDQKLLLDLIFRWEMSMPFLILYEKHQNGNEQYMNSTGY